MTCKDCIHYDVCGGFTPTDLDRDVFDYCREGRTDEIPDIEERCNGFKDKSRYIELPCKVGTELYLSDYLNEHHRLKEYKFCGDRIAVVIDCWEWQRTFTRWLDDFGKTIFLTREEAEKALSERSNK